MSAPGGSGEGGAALACGSLWQAGRRGSGRVTSTRGRSRGCRAPRSRRALQAPAAATKKGGRAEEAERRRKRRRGDSGMFPQDRGHQGGEGTGLEPLTDPPPISVPPSFLTALPLSSQTEPRATCPLYLFFWAGLGVLSCRGCLVYVSGEWQCHASGNCPRRATQDPSGVALLSSLGHLGMGKKENQTLSPSVTSCLCGHGEQLPWMDTALLQEASSIPSGP